MKKIALLPIDNRPVCYTLLKDIASVNKNTELIMPERIYLGGLFEKANIKELENWLININETDYIILSADTLAYGGLVSSRRIKDSYEEIKSRLDVIKNSIKEKKKKNKNLKVYLTSSIMRISNNNVAEEEKPYWADFGKEIFSYSYNSHKARINNENDNIKHNIPSGILEDYLLTRKRNYEINKLYLNWLEENVADFLIFSKDDTGLYGLNVEEAYNLKEEIIKRKLNAIVKTGADEIPLLLLLRAITENEEIKIKVEYKNKNSVNLISKYEDIPVEECVKSQIETGIKNAIITNSNPDIIFYINNFDKIQGDLVFKDVVNNTFDFNLNFDKPCIIADINNANGADWEFVENLVKNNIGDNFLSYSGYNTSSNAIGSALAIGISVYLAKKQNTFDKKAFNKIIITRLLDDWAYQADIRDYIKEAKDGNFVLELNKNIDKFKPYEDKIKNFLSDEFKVIYSLPWKRSFEAEFDVIEE